MAKPIYDFAIVGAGIAGSAGAYYLARAGRTCLLIEADEVASGASGFSAGLITPPIGLRLQPPLRDLMLAAFDLHQQLPETLGNGSGSGYELRHGGSVLVATEEVAAPALRSLLDDPVPRGRGARWLDPEQVTEVCPWIDQPQAGGIYEPSAGNLDPDRLTRAFCAAAQRAGARLAIDSVVSLEESGPGFRLRGSRDDYRAEQVLLAAGPWTGALAGQLGFEDSVYPLKGQILRLRLPPPHSAVGFSCPDGSYLSPRPDGQVWIGTTEESVGFDRATTDAARGLILARARRLSARIDESGVIAQTACLRPISRDGLPLIGPVPGVRGAWICTGHGRTGMLLGPVSARELVNLILERDTALALAPFDPVRLDAASAPRSFPAGESH
ncbi:MAG: FAD-binding oxidoreductase [Chloroflexi bacterium]|nr:FAD-binding oxidoreductase [Chloroflexota bacterium]